MYHDPASISESKLVPLLKKKTAGPNTRGHTTKKNRGLAPPGVNPRLK
jgi:hypothetical protein